MIKHLAIVLLFLPGYQVYAQKPKNNCPSIETLIKGRPYEEHIEKEFFEKDVELTLSDSSYRITSFAAVWNEPDGTLVERVYQGHIFKIASPRGDPYTFRSKKGCILTFQFVRFAKGKDTCSAAGIVVHITSKDSADKEKENIPCVARVAGLGRNPAVIANDIANGFTIELSDPSYTVINFDISAEDPETGDLLIAPVKGNLVSPANTRVANVLKSVRRGMVLICENITVMKNGKLYKIRPLNVYVK